MDASVAILWYGIDDNGGVSRQKDNADVFGCRIRPKQLVDAHSIGERHHDVKNDNQGMPVADEGIRLLIKGTAFCRNASIR
jgi:hypothetical protein